MVCHYWFLIMGSNFKTITVKGVDYRFVLFLTLASLKLFFCCKILRLMIVGIYKMHIREINIKNRVYSYYSDKKSKQKKYVNQ